MLTANLIDAPLFNTRCSWPSCFWIASVQQWGLESRQLPQSLLRQQSRRIETHTEHLLNDFPMQQSRCHLYVLHPLRVEVTGRIDCKPILLSNFRAALRLRLRFGRLRHMLAMVPSHETGLSGCSCVLRKEPQASYHPLHQILERSISPFRSVPLRVSTLGSASSSNSQQVACQFPLEAMDARDTPQKSVAPWHQRSCSSSSFCRRCYSGAVLGSC